MHKISWNALFLIKPIKNLLKKFDIFKTYLMFQISVQTFLSLPPSLSYMKQAWTLTSSMSLNRAFTPFSLLLINVKLWQFAKYRCKEIKITDQQKLSGSTVWSLTELMLSPVTHCHAGYICVSARVVGSITLNLNLSWFFLKHTNN